MNNIIEVSHADVIEIFEEKNGRRMGYLWSQPDGAFVAFACNPDNDSRFIAFCETKQDAIDRIISEYSFKPMDVLIAVALVFMLFTGAATLSLFMRHMNW